MILFCMQRSLNAQEPFKFHMDLPNLSQRGLCLRASAMDLEGSYFVCVCLAVKQKPGISLLQGARSSLKCARVLLTGFLLLV